MQEKINPLTGTSILYYDHLPPEKTAQVSRNKKTYDWNSWGEIIQPTKDSNQVKILATYTNQFYKGQAAIVSNTIGKGKVIYIGVTTIEGALEKEILKDAFINLKLPVIELPRYIYIEKRGNLNIAVNYSSVDFNISISKEQKMLLGEKKLKPGQVTVWSN
jgi:beta-galactosidase